MPTGAARFCARSALDDLIDANAGGRERVGTNVDVELRAVAADDVHLRHAGDRAQLAADRLIGELRELRPSEHVST